MTIPCGKNPAEKGDPFVEIGQRYLGGLSALAQQLIVDHAQRHVAYGENKIDETVRWRALGANVAVNFRPHTQH